MRLIEQGREHFANGDISRGISAFWAAAREQSEPTAIHELALGLILAGQWNELLRLLSVVNPPVPFFQCVCIDLAQRREYEMLGQLHREIPQNCILTPVAAYYAGVSMMAAKRQLEALRYFDEFKKGICQDIDLYRALIVADANFNLIFRQGSLVEPPGYVGALENSTIAVETPFPEIEFRRKALSGRSRTIFACCLNDLYFNRFAKSLTSSLYEKCGAVDLHFHIVGDQQDCSRVFADLETCYPEITLGLSLEKRPIALHNVYYACNRFIVLPKLLEAYDSNIIMLDADALVRQDLMPLAERLTSDEVAADFACFDTGRTEPASVFQATLMFFANTPNCLAFLDLLRRFIFSKINGRPKLTWMLDQAALFSVGYYLEAKEDSTFKFQRLDQLTGTGLADFADSAGTELEKAELMAAGTA